jgi:hypothetical protein
MKLRRSRSRVNSRFTSGRMAFATSSNNWCALTSRCMTPVEEGVAVAQAESE